MSKRKHQDKYRISGGGGPNKLLSDDQILSIRSRHEFEGVTKKQLQSEYPEVSPEHMRSILEYTTRSKLIPKQPRA